MTPNSTMLPSGAAAHALERARLAELRRSIAGRIEADNALLDRLGERSAAAATAGKADHDASRFNVGGAA